jgi:hypothetical protein
MATKKTTKNTKTTKEPTIKKLDANKLATDAGKNAQKAVFDSLNDDNLRTCLFDFGFTKFITPSIIKVLYIIGIAGIAACYLFLVITALFGANTLTFIGWLIGGAVGALISIVILRVYLELTVALVRVAQNTARK